MEAFDTRFFAQVVSLLGVTGTRESEQAEAKANRLKECQARLPKSWGCPIFHPRKTMGSQATEIGGMDGNGRIMVYPAIHGG